MKSNFIAVIICILLIICGLNSAYSQPAFDYHAHQIKKEAIKKLDNKHLQGTLDVNGYISLFQLTDSIKYLNFAEKKTKSDLDKIHYLKGKFYFYHYDTAQAFRSYLKIAGSKYKNDTYYCHLAQCYSVDKKYDSALSIINLLLQKKSASPLGLEVRSNILNKTNKYSEAIVDLQKLVTYYFNEREDDIALSFYYRIVEAESHINKRKGLQTLYKISHYYDGEGIAWQRNAKMRIASYYCDVLGSKDTAIMLYDTINQLFEKQSLANVYEVHLEQGKLYWDKNNRSKAYQCWMPCLKWYNHPEFLDYFEKLAIKHPNEKNIDLIINYIKFNMAISGSDKVVFNQVISSLTAIKMDKRYLSLKDYLISECYFQLADFPNALKFYDTALKNEKDKKQIINMMYRKSQCYWTLKNEKAYRNQIKEVEKFKRDNL